MEFVDSVAESEEGSVQLGNAQMVSSVDDNRLSNVLINVRSLYCSESTFVLMCTSFIE
jgi:hypothetical protein